MIWLVWFWLDNFSQVRTKFSACTHAHISSDCTSRHCSIHGSLPQLASSLCVPKALVWAEEIGWHAYEKIRCTMNTVSFTLPLHSLYLSHQITHARVVHGIHIGMSWKKCHILILWWTIAGNAGDWIVVLPKHSHPTRVYTPWVWAALSTEVCTPTSQFLCWIVPPYGPLSFWPYPLCQSSIILMLV